LLQGRYRKVGHGGTLDPFASGLLIVLTDRDTKKFRDYEGCKKEYSGEIMLGMETDTYDISGQAVPGDHDMRMPTYEELQRLAEGFVGTIQQRPPRYSALKHHGKPFYQLVRKGVYVEPDMRTVTVYDFSVRHYKYPLVVFRAVVGKGVYMRSIAHDLGARLGIGGTMMALRRQRIGDDSVKDAHTLGDLICGNRGS
jgi:tRNA pseudouridine55 synthase